MAKGMSITLRDETTRALEVLVDKWFDGRSDARNAAIQRAIIEAARELGESE